MDVSTLRIVSSNQIRPDQSKSTITDILGRPHPYLSVFWAHGNEDVFILHRFKVTEIYKVY